MIKVFKDTKGAKAVLASYDELLTHWSVDYTEVDIQTSFGKTHCIIAGKQENPPLLLLHGVGDNSAIMWVLNIKELSKHFYCIAVDTLGGPGKSIPNENFMKKKFTQRVWINEIADYFSLQRFNIAGVSNGAVMAANYAVKESDRVNKVVCMEGGFIVNPVKSMFSTIFLLFPEILIPTRNNMIRIMKKMVSPKSDVYDKHMEITEHFVLLMKNHNQRAMFVHDMDKYDRQAAIMIKDKFYFLIGGDKRSKENAFVDLLTEGGFKYNIIADAGHGINHEQAEVINDEIIKFLI